MMSILLRFDCLLLTVTLPPGYPDFLARVESLLGFTSPTLLREGRVVAPSSYEQFFLSEQLLKVQAKRSTSSQPLWTSLRHTEICEQSTQTATSELNRETESEINESLGRKVSLAAVKTVIESIGEQLDLRGSHLFTVKDTQCAGCLKGPTIGQLSQSRKGLVCINCKQKYEKRTVRPKSKAGFSLIAKKPKQERRKRQLFASLVRLGGSSVDWCEQQLACFPNDSVDQFILRVLRLF